MKNERQQFKDEIRGLTVDLTSPTSHASKLVTFLTEHILAPPELPAGAGHRPIGNLAAESVGSSNVNEDMQSLTLLSDQLLMRTGLTLPQAELLVKVSGLHPSPEMRSSFTRHYGEPNVDPTRAGGRDDALTMRQMCWVWRDWADESVNGHFNSDGVPQMTYLGHSGRRISAIKAAIMAFRPDEVPSGVWKHLRAKSSVCLRGDVCVNPWHAHIVKSGGMYKSGVVLDDPESIARQEIFVEALSAGIEFTAVTHVPAAEVCKVRNRANEVLFKPEVLNCKPDNSDHPPISRPPTHGFCDNAPFPVPLHGRSWGTRRRSYRTLGTVMADHICGRPVLGADAVMTPCIWTRPVDSVVDPALVASVQAVLSLPRLVMHIEGDSLCKTFQLERYLTDCR